MADGIPQGWVPVANKPKIYKATVPGIIDTNKRSTNLPVETNYSNGNFIVYEPTLFGDKAIYTYNASDIRLKENIILIGLSNLGINIYEYNYINDPEIRYIGVMAQELLGTQFEKAVTIAENGYYAVDYSKIDVKFEKLELV